MGGYTTSTTGAGSTGEFPIPLLTLGAELDGGLGRPAAMHLRVRSAVAASVQHTDDSNWET